MSCTPLRLVCAALIAAGAGDAARAEPEANEAGTCREAYDGARQLLAIHAVGVAVAPPPPTLVERARALEDLEARVRVKRGVITGLERESRSPDVEVAYGPGIRAHLERSIAEKRAQLAAHEGRYAALRAASPARLQTASGREQVLFEAMHAERTQRLRPLLREPAACDPAKLRALRSAVEASLAALAERAHGQPWSQELQR